MTGAVVAGTVGGSGTGGSFEEDPGLFPLLRLMTLLMEAVNLFLMDFSSPTELPPAIFGNGRFSLKEGRSSRRQNVEVG